MDGTWQKRGFVSLHGVVFVMSIEKGLVLDYIVKTKVCHVCKKNKNKSNEWKARHAPNCKVNHYGSAGAMESEAAVEMFTRSIERHNLFYGIYVGDGDSSSFGAVACAVKEHYGNDYDTEKEDCISHIQKWLGTSLCSYKNKLRGVKLKDGESVGERGCLTDAIVDKMQTCYGYAIRNNIGNKENIRNAIFALFYHMILGPSYESLSTQHKYCPEGIGSWCKYQVDISSNTDKYDRTKCLPFIFLG